MASDAMWYKDGIFYDVKTTHVNFFLNHPDLFGFSQKEKEALCVKNGLAADSTFCPEPSVQRDNLVLAVLKRGAVRIRFYGGQTSVQCYDHNNILSFTQLKNCVAGGMRKCFGNFLTVKDTLGWGMNLNNIGWGNQIDDFLNITNCKMTNRRRCVMSEEKKETKNNAKNTVEEILKRIDEGEDRVLNQNEIDTLLTAIASDEEYKPVNSARKIKIYDFERPDKFSKEDLRDISNVSETIARELTKFFTSEYEIFPKFHVASVDQLTCEEFLRGIPTPTPCISFSWMDSEGIFEMDWEVFFNGFMRTKLKHPRDINGLEKNLFTRDIYGPIERIIHKEFSNTTGKELPEITEQEFVDNPQFLFKYNSPTDMGVLVTIEVSLNNVENFIEIFLSEDLVKALRENGFFSERKFFQKKGEIIIPLTYPEPDTIIEVGRFRLEDNFKIKKNMIFESNKLAGEPLDIFKNGRQVALGEAVIIDDNRGVRVTENMETPKEETFYNTKILYGGCSTEAEEKFGEGRIFELREWWNEPAKVVKDNKVIAYGEIKILDENFGVKITEVVE